MEPKTIRRIGPRERADALARKYGWPRIDPLIIEPVSPPRPAPARSVRPPEAETPAVAPRALSKEEQDKWDLKLIQATRIGQARDALEHGADINCGVQNQSMGIDNASVLIFAVIEDRPKLVDFYLEQPRIDINRKDAHGFSAIMRAEFFGRTEMVEKLRAKGVVFTDDDRQKVYNLRLMRAETVEQARDALEHGADINCGVQNQWKGIHYASVLIFAVIEDRPKLVDFYLEQPRIDINKKDDQRFSALMRAEFLGRSKMVAKLRAKSAVCSEDDMRLVYGLRLIRAENVKEARDALEHGADINIGVWRGKIIQNATVLIAAVIDGNGKLFDFYLSQEGTDIARRDNVGWNALMYAKHHKRADMEAKLRSKGLVLTAGEEDAVRTYKAYHPK